MGSETKSRIVAFIELFVAIVIPFASSIIWTTHVIR